MLSPSSAPTPEIDAYEALPCKGDEKNIVRLKYAQRFLSEKINALSRLSASALVCAVFRYVRGETINSFQLIVSKYLLSLCMHQNKAGLMTV